MNNIPSPSSFCDLPSTSPLQPFSHRPTTFVCGKLCWCPLVFACNIILIKYIIQYGCGWACRRFLIVIIIVIVIVIQPFTLSSSGCVYCVTSNLICKYLNEENPLNPLQQCYCWTRIYLQMFCGSLFLPAESCLRVSWGGWVGCGDGMVMIIDAIENRVFDILKSVRVSNSWVSLECAVCKTMIPSRAY